MRSKVRSPGVVAAPSLEVRPRERVLVRAFGRRHRPVPARAGLLHRTQHPSLRPDGGVDRSIVLSAQVFTALIPLFIIVASVAPTGQEDVISEGIIKRFALGCVGQRGGAAVRQRPGATSSVTVFSALMLSTGVAFTRRLQLMYTAAWGGSRPASGVPCSPPWPGRPDPGVLVAYGIREFTTLVPFGSR